MCTSKRHIGRWIMCFIVCSNSNSHNVDVSSNNLHFFKLPLVRPTPAFIRILRMSHSSWFPNGQDSLRIHLLLLFLNWFLHVITLSCFVVVDKKLGLFLGNNFLIYSKITYICRIPWVSIVFHYNFSFPICLYRPFDCRWCF